MLAPNWEDHNLETNPIINYSADRNHTEMVFKKVENRVKNGVFTVKNAKTAKHFRNI